MAESRDPAIKLFGKTIPLQPSGESPPGSGGVESGGEANKDLQTKESTTPESKDQGHESPESEEKTGDPDKPSSSNQADTPMKDSNPEEQQPKDTSNSQERAPKKPDKVLPCPRCNSLDTKFCYFNNYNVNQPRHFCKNCQRYWTAGGTMRNVPVGAGRRKNKNSAAAYYRHITLPDSALQAVHSDIAATGAIHRHPSLKPNGTVLSFGSDVPLSESMASVLNLAEKPATKSCARNGLHQMEENIIPLSSGVGNTEEQSTGSSAMTSSNSKEEGSKGTSPRKVPAPIPCLNGSSLPYAWSPTPLCASNFAVPFHPATAYWGCTVPGSWSIQWLSPRSPGSGSNSPTLGKHSREGDSFQQTDQQRILWMPKTLRMDDPEEAAKSSIWAMMGVKNGTASAVSSRALFKAFQPKVDIKGHTLETSQLFHANPAALSRSLSFQESS